MSFFAIMLHLEASNFLPLIPECQINICEIGFFCHHVKHIRKHDFRVYSCGWK